MRRRDLAALLPRASRYAVQYLRRQHRGQPTPVVLSFLVTARCPLACQHCFHHHAELHADDELSLDEYRGLATGLDDFAVGLFCGGEPFVRDDLAELIHLFRREADLLFPLVSTNGQLTSAILQQTEQILSRCRTRPFILSLSLDGFEEQHDRIRGAGTFDRALRSWREAQRLARHYDNLLLTVTTVVSSLNQQVAPSFVRWAWQELSPANVGVLLVRQSPRAGPELKQVEPRQYRAAQTEALRPLARWPLGWLSHPQLPFLATMAEGVSRTMATGQRSFRCHAGRHGAAIDHRGQIHACEALAECVEVGDMGSLRDADMDFPSLWTSDRADRVRRWVGRHEICASCTHETMGYLPSLPFSGNRLRLRPRRLTA